MNLKDLNPQLQAQINSFVAELAQLAGSNLISVLLYGGAAKADHTYGRSNVNMLFVFDNVDLPVLDSLVLLFQKAMGEFRMAPFILTHSEVVPSSDVFAIKLFDMQQHHILLHGTDVLAGLDFDRSHLKFLSEEEISNQLARMKYFYIRNFNLPELLLQRVQKGFTTLVINANTYLYLRHNRYYATRKEITEQLLKEPGMDAAALEMLLALKDNAGLAGSEAIKQGYDVLMLQYKQLLKAYKQIHSHGEPV